MANQQQWHGRVRLVRLQCRVQRKKSPSGSRAVVPGGPRGQPTTMGSIINLWDRPDLRALPVEMNSTTKKMPGGRESLRKWRNGRSRISNSTTILKTALRIVRGAWFEQKVMPSPMQTALVSSARQFSRILSAQPMS